MNREDLMMLHVYEDEEYRNTLITGQICDLDRDCKKKREKRTESRPSR
jgi:hypothetical protein